MQVTSTGLSLLKSRSGHLSRRLPVDSSHSIIAEHWRMLSGLADNGSGAWRRKTGEGGVGGLSCSPGACEGSDEDRGPKCGGEGEAGREGG